MHTRGILYPGPKSIEVSTRLTIFHKSYASTHGLWTNSILAFEHDRKGGVLRASQRAFIESVVSRYGVDAVSDLPASQSADLDPRTNDEPVCDKPVRVAAGKLIWLGGMTRPDIADAVRAVARHTHNPPERHWRAVRKMIAYLNKTKDLEFVFVKDGDQKLSVYVDADYTNKDNDWRSVSGVAVTVGGTTVNASSTTQHFVTLSARLSGEEHVYGGSFPRVTV